MLKESWKNPLLFDDVQPDLNLNMCFATFVLLYCVSSTSQISTRYGNQFKIVPIFSPEFRAINKNHYYYKSCWFALLKFKPWNTNCETLLVDAVEIDSCLDISNVSEEMQNNIINSWESYMNHPDNLNNPNDNLIREIDNTKSEKMVMMEI